MEVEINYENSKVENWEAMQLVRSIKSGMLILTTSLAGEGSQNFSGVVISRGGGNFDAGHFGSQWRKETFEKFPSGVEVTLRNT